MPAQKRRKRLTFLLAALLPMTGITGSLLVNWRFLYRVATYPEEPIMAADWYEPQAPVSGRSNAALPTANLLPSSPLTNALEQVSNYARDRNSTGLIVLHRGEIVWEEYWRGYDATSAFNSMSMAKTVVGLLVGIAIAEGDIETIDDPVANYISEWRQDDRAKITLKDLLYMQSGLRNDSRTDTPFSDLVQMYMGLDVARVALSIPSIGSPGQAFEYNNANSQILAIVLQRATATPYPRYLSSRLWQSLGASDAGIWLDRSNGTAKTFCCLFATARDWARVGQMLLDQGQFEQRQIVPPEWIQQMLTPSPLEPTFGYHVWVKARTPQYPNVDQGATESFIAEDTFYLDGRDVQRVYIIPSEEVVVVRMGELPATWDDAVIPNTLVKALKNTP